MMITGIEINGEMYRPHDIDVCADCIQCSLNEWCRTNFLFSTVCDKVLEETQIWRKETKPKK